MPIFCTCQRVAVGGGGVGKIRSSDIISQLLENLALELSHGEGGVVRLDTQASHKDGRSALGINHIVEDAH